MNDAISVNVINPFQNLTSNVQLHADITAKDILGLPVASIEPMAKRLGAQLHLNVKHTDRERRPRA